MHKLLMLGAMIGIGFGLSKFMDKHKKANETQSQMQSSEN